MSRTGRLVDHIHLRVADLDASKRFYRAVLESLGLADTFTEAAGHFHADELYVDRADGAVSNVHLAFQARDVDAVHRFHAAALAAGGRDNGAPGPRDYHPGYYAAFALDPDGNNIEAVWHGPRDGSAAAVQASTATTTSTAAAAPRRLDPRLPPGADRRRQERKPFRGSAELRFAAAPPLAVRTFDLSSSGLGIVASVNLPTGLACVVAVALPIRPGQYATVELAATVVHSVLASGENGFKIGLQFNALSPEAAVAVAQAVGG